MCPWSGLQQDLCLIDREAFSFEKANSGPAHSFHPGCIQLAHSSHCLCSMLWWHWQRLEHVHVNATTPTGLELRFDVTLPLVPCALLNVDSNDPTGQWQSLHLDKKHHGVWKHCICKEGKFIGEQSHIKLGSTLLSEDHLRELAVKSGAVEKVGEEEEKWWMKWRKFAGVVLVLQGNMVSAATHEMTSKGLTLA